MTHTFLLREIRALRDSGFEIHVISIHGSDRSLEQLSALEREERDKTYVVLQAGLASLVRAHLGAMLRTPWTYLKGAAYALRLAGLDLRKMVSNAMYFGEAVVVGAEARRRGVKHLHSHFSSTVALIAARVFPLTFSATIHGADEFADSKGYYLPQKVAEAKFLCAISKYSCSQLMRISEPRHWEKLEVAPLGVDPNVFCPRPHRDRPERLEILTVGRLASAKGQHILIAAIQRLVRQERRSIRLRIVGDGPMRSELEREIAEQELEHYVRLEGGVGQDRILAFYRDADVFVMSSFAEGVPVVLMEAMAMEIPCIATWVAGVPELIRHGVDGWLIPPSDAEALAAAICEFMDDSDLRRRLGKAARERVVEKFNLGRNVACLAEIFRRRLDGPNAR
ncbi:MAG TPA: glycosyltransferase family 4 protein [Bryobacteraceae bacterium]|nr:glycosyltransferase family 4 protein [Bryobacteraceae bacterium]